jgi:hypothetical protein
MKHTLTGILALAATMASGHAALYTFDSNATVNNYSGPALNSSVQIGFGTMEEILDGEGSGTGRDRWVFDSAPLDPITADPSLEGYGPSGSSLNTFNQTVLISFDTAFNLTNFSIFMDGSTFGSTSYVEFYDVNDNLISTLDAFGLIANYEVIGSNINGVSKIVLPSGAFFDNMTLAGSAVPEPGSVTLAGLAALALATRRRRRA